MSFEEKYLKYKQKYLKLKNMEGGLFPKMKVPSLPSLSKNPEQLVVAARTKFTNSKLLVNKTAADLRSNEELERLAIKENSKNNNSATLAKVEAAKKKVVASKVAVQNATNGVVTARQAYINAKRVAREAKLAAANKAVADAKLKQSNANNELALAIKNLEAVKATEAARLAKKEAKKTKKVGSNSPVYSSDEELNEEPSE